MIRRILDTIFRARHPVIVRRKPDRMPYEQWRERPSGALSRETQQRLIRLAIGEATRKAA